jgi:hypothetical protein
VSSRLASRSLTEASIRVSMPFSAAPSRPTSVPGSCGLTLSVRSPAVILSAWPAIRSIGRSPRRSTRPMPPATSRPTATEAMARISSRWSTVLFKSLRLVVA